MSKPIPEVGEKVEGWLLRVEEILEFATRRGEQRTEARGAKARSALVNYRSWEITGDLIVTSGVDADRVEG